MAKQKEQLPRKPDYNVGALSKRTEHRGKVGSAWANADGSITVSLNQFVVLSAMDDLVITLFPKSWDERKDKP